MLARRSAMDEFGCGDETVAECDLLDDIGVVARAAEPLIDLPEERRGGGWTKRMSAW